VRVGWSDYAGFVVAAINRYGDDGKDSARGGEQSSFLARPADPIRLLDLVLNDWKDKVVVAAPRGCSDVAVGFDGQRFTAKRPSLVISENNLCLMMQLAEVPLTAWWALLIAVP
jgi:hypothetical protein